MKKLLLSILILTFAISCQKKENITETKEPVEQPKVEEKTVNYKPVFVQQKALQKVSMEELENLVGAHDNDTIYINNFFATWCGPCIREMPFFKQKMEDLKGQPVKFTFISIDEPEDWDTEVKDFAKKYQLGKNIVLVDASLLTPQFFSENFVDWDGSYIPYTSIKKADKSVAVSASTTLEILDEKIKSLQ